MIFHELPHEQMTTITQDLNTLIHDQLKANLGS